MKLEGLNHTFNRRESHPSRGAWIEIGLGAREVSVGTSRTPRGVRGLKFSIWSSIFMSSSVAPLAGGVD